MKKILVVDDDRILSGMVEDMLDWKGYDVKVIWDAKNAIPYLKENDVDLVLLDKLISGVDGTDVCRWIREEDSFTELPILMMTAMHQSEKICYEAGATGFIAKPFEMDDFLEKIENLLK